VRITQWKDNNRERSTGLKIASKCSNTVRWEILQAQPFKQIKAIAEHNIRLSTTTKTPKCGYIRGTTSRQDPAAEDDRSAKPNHTSVKRVMIWRMHKPPPTQGLIESVAIILYGTPAGTKRSDTQRIQRSNTSCIYRVSDWHQTGAVSYHALETLYSSLHLLNL
jgi:hypothetical protein